MKRTLLIIAAASLALAGCQDEQSSAALSSSDTATPQETAPQPTGEHTANNSLDWNGTYVGILPCADCSGIETRISLNHDDSYQIEQTYLGKQDGYFISQGQLSWNEAGNTVILEQESGANQYFVGENVLFKLDINGQRVEGDLAQHYQLKKQ
ncbi:putative lipoprotein [Vibrio sinaloensis DSM 21326]|uniref:Putative lipoprotein n=1 Tax=Vibrio sinaloensis DSM 21326 TaxID=945550 RepID=E8M6A2_PHOS4|nr:copper resistance protein NlpE [Vibrio sinaloensis]EGA70552.1 putative lipoprotein [Vibrio sinaloensis DSM 21326]